MGSECANPRRFPLAAARSIRFGTVLPIPEPVVSHDPGAKATFRLPGPSSQFLTRVEAPAWYANLLKSFNFPYQ